MQKETNLPPSLMPYRLITRKQLQALIPFCSQHILRLEKAGKFPKRRVIGQNRVAWREEEVIHWIATRPSPDHSDAEDDST